MKQEQQAARAHVRAVSCQGTSLTFVKEPHPFYPMEAHRVFFTTVAIAAIVASAGCAAPDVTNTKRNRDDLARMEDRAKQYEKQDGSLGGDYLADLFLNGSGKKSNKPVFDQPRGDEKSP